ncbi:MAG: FAD-linked oxidase C-terminal domain-containing protein [Chloroflexota bacterium]|nr:FAD-linked oxidase C-terminal domain-containing protein [Chloroflexota bacterium]
MINVEALQNIVGKDWVITKREQMESYLVDETAPVMKLKPADNVVVVKPANSEEISEIMKLANRDKTIVYPRGAGTGLVGGAIPSQDGVVLSLERLDKIEEVDKENLMVVAEAGVTLGDLLKAVEDADMLFPPHPGDEGAQVGGVVACNAGGTRAVKYGVIRSYVKGMEVVLPTGEIVSWGGKLLKNNTGLDLMQLMIDSEGILGIITRVTFRLYPKFAGIATLIVSYDDRHAAINAVPKILQSGVIPLAVEYIERDAVDVSTEYLGLKWPAEKGNAYLMIIVTGVNEDDVYAQCEKISEVCQGYGALDVLIAERREEQADILKIRSEMYSALKPRVADIMDAAVPPAEMANLMDTIDEIAEEYHTHIITFGHAGDGNLHSHILRDVYERGQLHEVKDRIYREAVALGGVVTAEHGIGKIRLPNLSLCVDEKSLEIMKAIKKVFDPNNILNPGTAIG